MRCNHLGYTCPVLQGREPTFGDGRYIIRRELGRGTMGVVYEAEDTVLARTVAVKTIDLAFVAGEGTSSEFEQRFFTEARVAARLSHPGIVVCHDVGKDAASGKLFIVFEYLKGRTLAARADEGPMDWRDALEIVVQVARALHHTHEHGVVHRDLKPANIMLVSSATAGTPAGGANASVKIMDFGVACLDTLGQRQRLTRTGQSFGSPLYMSPEQALGQPSGARADIFSLGSVLCTLLLGKPWFSAGSIPAIVRRVLHDDPPRLADLRPDLPESLDAVLAMALAKRPDDRYATAADLADDLEDVLAGRAAKHAAAGVSSSVARVAGQDALLADMTAPIGGARESAAGDPLAGLLDESPLHEAATLPGAATATLAPQGTVVGASTVVTPDARRRWLLAVSALALAVLAAGALFSWRRSSVREPGPVPSAPVVVATAPASMPESASPSPTPTTSTSPAPIAPTTPVPTATTSAIPVVQPRSPAPTASPIVEPSPTNAPEAHERAAGAMPASDASQSRIRLSLEHPFENGRMIVWIDGVLVYETKLQATGSKKIVAFKVREGHAEKLLDVQPGPHEVRVEVTWDQGRRASTKVVDVASGATGLLDIRVGRMSKDLSLTWSRLAKD
jgi:eukaryotic-like serine/threonine-protein kinase